ncbi:MAG: nucleotidyltransferase domain-containing protein [Bacteroidaceae bacterium]|nr:nucleotidyltransferase domain-containing protein [Bacteroidaceae bacterium]
MKRPNIIRQIKEAIRRKDAKATAILYGSEARGEARADSDIDVLILVDGDKLSVAREQEYTAPLYEIEWSTGVQISPTVMLRSKWENRPFDTPFFLNVMNEGIVL